MSWRLALASLWLPPWTVRRELTRVAEATTSVLDRLLAECSPIALDGARQADSPLRGSLRRRRAALASAHTARVTRLCETLGRDEGIDAARRALFEAGVKLGREARRRLGVRQTRPELLRAARVLYRVLGIRFRAKWATHDAAKIRVARCALACGYTSEACLALSATDAGVVAGLWPGTKFEFDERITDGRDSCVARLVLPEAMDEAVE
jgi:predicted ArsR family transcriptional regulator